MEPWMWAIVGVVPVIAVGTAYAMGAFGTDTASIDQKIAESREFRGDSIGGKRKTKKSSSHHKKTKRSHKK